MWRLSPDKPTMALMVEATNDHFTLPEKGLLGRHAIFDPAMLDTPKIDDAFRAQQDERTWKVSVKRRNQVSTVTFPYNPLDAVGWHGDLSAVRINWRDIRPLMSHRSHLPPSAHTTFVAGRFVVCTFVPRPFESDPEALNVPFFHNNDDYDEVIFYHEGDFFSRDNIHPGMMTLHPSGFTHGPHPKAFNAATRSVEGRQDRDRRGRGDDRHARRNRRRRHAGRRRVRRLREIVASAGDEAGRGVGAAPVEGIFGRYGDRKFDLKSRIRSKLPLTLCEVLLIYALRQPLGQRGRIQ